MIFVTLGTQDKSFTRLLKAIDKAIKAKEITDQVIVQAGFTDYQSEDMQIYKYLSMGEFDKYIKECDLLITHAGVGSIMNGLKYHKKIIAVPRLAKYGEHTNDHQIEIATEFAKCNYLVYVKDVTKIGKEVKNIKNFKPQAFVSNNAHFLQIIEDFINQN